MQQEKSPKMRSFVRFHVQGIKWFSARWDWGTTYDHSMKGEQLQRIEKHIDISRSWIHFNFISHFFHSLFNLNVFSVFLKYIFQKMNGMYYFLQFCTKLFKIYFEFSQIAWTWENCRKTHDKRVFMPLYYEGLWMKKS